MTVAGNVLRAGPAAWRRGAGRRHRRRAVQLVPRLLATIGDPAQRWVAGPAVGQQHPHGGGAARAARRPAGGDGQAARHPGRRDEPAARRPSARRAGRRARGGRLHPVPPAAHDRRLRRRPAVRARAGDAGDRRRHRASGSRVAASVTVGAASAIGVLHARTAHSAVVDAALLRRWVDLRVDILARATRRRDAVDGPAQAAARRLGRAGGRDRLGARRLLARQRHGRPGDGCRRRASSTGSGRPATSCPPRTSSTRACTRGCWRAAASSATSWPRCSSGLTGRRPSWRCTAPPTPRSRPSSIPTCCCWCGCARSPPTSCRRRRLAHNPLWVLRNVVSVLRALPELPAVAK